MHLVARHRVRPFAAPVGREGDVGNVPANRDGLDAAHEIARAARPEDVLAYADAVLVEAAEMLAGFTPARFDELPPNREDFRDDRYSAPGYIADLDGMFEQPYWRVFAGACTGHCRGHIGELELALAVIRAG